MGRWDRMVLRSSGGRVLSDIFGLVVLVVCPERVDEEE